MVSITESYLFVSSRYDEYGRIFVYKRYCAVSLFLTSGVVFISFTVLGIPWFIGMTLLQCMYFITRGKVDKQRRLPILISQCWGEALLTLTRMWPKITNRDILQRYYSQNRPAMIVANHNSWMDIPFLGVTIGWRNYKLVSKKELGRVPILGKSIKVGGHIMVDRADRKSQLRTLKAGINLLKVRCIVESLHDVFSANYLLTSFHDTGRYNSWYFSRRYSLAQW